MQEDVALLARLAAVVLDSDDNPAFCRGLGTTRGGLRALLDRVDKYLADPPKVKVGAYISGGNLQGVRASAPVEFEVYDHDNYEAEDAATQKEMRKVLRWYNKLPAPIW